MSSSRPIAYAFHADHYCEDCTARYVARAYGVPEGSALELLEEKELEDSEGNPIHAILPWDEWWDASSGECELLACSYCHFPLAAAHREECRHQWGELECTFPEELLP